MKRITLKIAGMLFTMPGEWVMNKWYVFPMFWKTPRHANDNRKWRD